MFGIGAVVAADDRADPAAVFLPRGGCQELCDRCAASEGVIPAGRGRVGAAELHAGGIAQGGGQGGVFDLECGTGFAQIVDSGQESDEQAGVSVRPACDTADEMFDLVRQMAVPQHARHFGGVEHVPEQQVGARRPRVAAGIRFCPQSTHRGVHLGHNSGGAGNGGTGKSGAV